MTTQNMSWEWTRRRFLTTAGAGVGLGIVPGFLSGCGGAKVGPYPTSVSGTPSQIGYFSSFGIGKTVIGQVIGKAMSKGGDFADLYFQHKITNYLGLQDGEVNRAYSVVDLGCGVRVLSGEKTGFAFTEDLSTASLLKAAETAAVVANGPEVPLVKTLHRVSAPSYYEVEIPWTEVEIAKKIPLLEQANNTALAFDNRIIKVQAFLADTTSHLLLATSEGVFAEDLQPMTTAFVTCVAEDNGRREENYGSYGTRSGFEFYSNQRIDELARMAAKRTIVLFDAAQPPPGEYPVVLAPGFSGILLHEAIGHGMEADFNRKGISVYADRMGTRIAPEFVTIVDDGTNPQARGSINIDDEGLASNRTVLVEDGILRSYMHDRISAKHYNVEPTSNGRRDCFRFPPVPRMRNTYMLNGPHKPEEIIASVKKGIYAEQFTNGQVRIGSGDFSFYVKNGYLIEDGRLTQPIKDANLIGFGPKVLEKIEMVADDMKMDQGAGTCGKDGQRVPVGMGLPTCKCGGISVGGVG
jgi:TldD protein